MIRYDPADPWQAEIDSFWNLLFLLAWPWVIGVAVAGIGAMLWRLAARGVL